MEKRIAIILLNYKDYAEKYLGDCLASLNKQDYRGKMKIFIVDNETSGQSLAMINGFVGNYPEQEIELILNKANDGFAKGNNDAMKLALGQGFDGIILFNMDVVVEADCVRKMIEAAYGSLADKQGDSAIGIVQARLMLWPDKDKVNSLGNVTHFLGFGYSSGYQEKYDPQDKGISEICYPSGAAVLLTRELLEDVGLFDEEIWMYNEDQDVGWRAWLAGYKCVLAPDAVVYHKYEFSRSIQKYYWMDRNRLFVIFKNYKFLTLLLIFPALLVMELGLFLFAWQGGWIKEKLRVYKYWLNLKNWVYLRRTRAGVQALRRAKDRDIIRMFSGKIWYQEIGDWKLKVANVGLNIYWQIIKFVIRW